MSEHKEGYYFVNVKHSGWEVLYWHAEKAEWRHNRYVPVNDYNEYLAVNECRILMPDEVSPKIIDGMSLRLRCQQHGRAPDHYRYELDNTLNHKCSCGSIRFYQKEKFDGVRCFGCNAVETHFNVNIDQPLKS